MQQERNHSAVEIPHLGSLILTHSWDGQLPGLKEVAPEDRPNATVVFWTFRRLVGLGGLMRRPDEQRAATAQAFHPATPPAIAAADPETAATAMRGHLRQVSIDSSRLQPLESQRWGAPANGETAQSTSGRRRAEPVLKEEIP